MRSRLQCSSAHWSKYKARHVILHGGAPRRHDRTFQLRGILLSAVVATVGAVKSAAIAIRNADVFKLAHHRQVDFAAFFIAGNRESAECCSVITLLAAQNLIPIPLAHLHLGLAPKFPRGL